MTVAIINTTAMIEENPARSGSPTEGSYGWGSHISSGHGSRAVIPKGTQIVSLSLTITSIAGTLASLR